MSQITSLRIDRLTVSGFGCFEEEQSWDFGSLTTIAGHNRQGKSTIADALAFGLTGAPYFGGNNLDRLHSTELPFLCVQLDVTTDNSARHTILRTRQNSHVTVSVDGTEITQARFAERFGSKDTILALFNPLYFAEIMGADGRKLLESLLPAVSDEAVLSKLSEHTRAALDGDSLGTPETYLKNRRDELKALQNDRLVLEGQAEQTERQRETLQQTLAEKQASLTQTRAALAPLQQQQATLDTGALNAEIAKLGAQYEAVQDGEMDQRRAALETHLVAIRGEQYQSPNEKPLAEWSAYLQQQVGAYQAAQEQYAALRQQGICPTCLRVIDATTLPEIDNAFGARIDEIKANGAKARQQHDAIAAEEQKRRQQFAEWQTAEIGKVTQQLAEANQPQSTEQRRAAIKTKIKELSAELALGGLTAEQAAQYRELFHTQGKLESEVEQLTAMLDGLPKGQREGVAALDKQIVEKNEKIAAAKAFLAERAAQLFAPVQLPHTSIRLFETLKESGEIRDVFKLTYDERDFVQLSLSERVRCGLEIVALLSRLSGKSYPLFVDNTESFCDLGSARPSGQLILARVVKNQTLTVTNLDAAQQKAG